MREPIVPAGCKKTLALGVAVLAQAVALCSLLSPRSFSVRLSLAQIGLTLAFKPVNGPYTTCA